MVERDSMTSFLKFHQPHATPSPFGNDYPFDKESAAKSNESANEKRWANGRSKPEKKAFCLQNERLAKAIFLNQSAGDLVIDFAGVDSIRSSDLNDLLRIYTQLRRRNSHLVIENVSSEIQHIFQITRLDRLFPAAQKSEVSTDG
jgi:anti-anti-sigma factor